MLCTRCNFKEVMYNEPICYECYEFEHYDKFSAHVNDIPDDILRVQNKCPIAYSNIDDIREWYIDNGMAITYYTKKKN